jgi:hypothetical protein
MCCLNSVADVVYGLAVIEGSCKRIANSVADTRELASGLTRNFYGGRENGDMGTVAP